MSRRISKTFAVILVAFAAIFDALSLIPGIGQPLAVGGQIVIACLFYAAGVNVFKHKQAIVYFTTLVLEAIPAAGSLPFFLVQTFALIGLSRAGRI
jgi:hypothetical protein